MGPRHPSSRSGQEGFWRFPAGLDLGLDPRIGEIGGDALNESGTIDGAWRSRLFWRLQFAGWGTTILLTVLFSSAGFFPFRYVLLLGVVRTVYGFAATCALRPLYHRLRKGGGNIWFGAAGVFLLCGLVALGDGMITGWAGHASGAPMDGEEVRLFIPASVFMRWMIYWLWSLLYFGINFWLDTQHGKLRLARAETEARIGELRQLRAQVNPHFLFNALNSIQAVAGDAAVARPLIQAFADYLRFSLEQRGDFQPLGAELDALENYLRVEKVRFEEKFEYGIAADGAARQAPAPIALVQPLLENAVKYGQRSGRWPLRVNIAAALEGETLVLSVTNSGEWIEPGVAASTGTGLANLRRRLHLLYGDEAELTTGAADGVVRAVVRIPAEKGEAP